MMPFSPWLGLPGEAQAQARTKTEQVGWKPLDPRQSMVGFVGPSRGDMMPNAQAQLAAAQAQAAPPAATPTPPPNVPRGTSASFSSERRGPSQNLQEMINAMNARELQSLEQQGLTAENLRKRLGELEGKDIPLDLTALAALTDEWTGSNFAGVYRPQETKKDRTAATEKLRGQVLAAEQGLTGAELDMMKNQLNSQFQVEKFGFDQSRAAADDDFRRRQLEAMKSDKGDLRIEKDVQELHKRSGEMLPGVVDKLTKMDDILQRSGKDLPGVGTGETWTPDFMLGADGQMLRQLGEDLRADVIKMYSGTAASDREVTRRLQAMGGAWKNTDEQFVQGLQFLRDSVAAKQASTEAAFRPEVTQTFKSRGGITAGDIRSVNLQTGGGTATRAEKSKRYSPSRNQTEITYSDGTTEVVDGRK